MTERDAVKQVVEQSITLKVAVEELRKWAKDRYAKAVKARDADYNEPSYFWHYEGQTYAYGRLIQKLDEIERGGKV